MSEGMSPKKDGVNKVGWRLPIKVWADINHGINSRIDTTIDTAIKNPLTKVSAAIFGKTLSKDKKGRRKLVRAFLVKEKRISSRIVQQDPTLAKIVMGVPVLIILMIAIYLIMSFMTGTAYAQSLPRSPWTPNPIEENGYGINLSSFGYLIDEGSQSIMMEKIINVVYNETSTKIIKALNTFVAMCMSIVFIYNFFSWLLDMVHTGKVMGNSVSIFWPIRMLIAITFIMPIPSQKGLNLAEIGVLSVASGGLGFGQMGWGIIVDDVVNHGAHLPMPVAPEASALINRMMIGETCYFMIQGKNELNQQYGYSTRVQIPRWEDVYKVETYKEDRFFGSDTYEKHIIDWGPYCGSMIFTSKESFGSISGKEIADAHVKATREARAKIQTAATQIAKRFYGNPEAALPPSATFREISEGYTRTVTQTLAESRPKNEWEARQRLMQSTDFFTAGGLFFKASSMNDKLFSISRRVPEVSGPHLQRLNGVASQNVVMAISTAQAWIDNMTETAVERATTYRNEDSADDALIERIFGMAKFQRVIDLMNVSETAPLASLGSLGSTLIDGVQLAWIGSGIIFSTSSATAEAAAAGSNAVGGVGALLGAPLAGTARFVAAQMQWLSGLIHAILGMLLLLGFYFAYIIQFGPVIRWFWGCIMYTAVILQAVVASTVWCLSQMQMGGDKFLSPAGQSGHILFIKLVFTPIGMVFGMLFGMVLFTIQAGLLMTLFTYTVADVADPNTFHGVISLIGYLVFFGICFHAIMQHSFGLIDKIPAAIVSGIIGGMDHEVGATTENSLRAFGMINSRIENISPQVRAATMVSQGAMNAAATKSETKGYADEAKHLADAEPRKFK